MRLKRKTIIILSMIVALSLAGLIFVQLIYLNHAYERELRIFSQNVNGALHSIVRKLEAREVRVIVKNMVSDSDERVIKPSPAPVSGESMRVFSDSSVAEITGIELTLETDSISGIGKSGTFNVILIDSTGFATDSLPGRRVIETTASIVGTDSIAHTMFLERRLIVEKVLKDMDGMGDVSILERVTPADLDSIVSITMNEAGIGTDYAYGVSSNGDSIVIAVPDKFREELLLSGFRTRLFPHDLVARDDELLLYFPDQSSYLLGREGAYLLLALLSIAMIAGSFIYVIRTIYMEKRFSRLLVDFINNMTHEFKTPVSTIAIIGENLAVGPQSTDHGRLNNYSRIISEESGRMKRQIEKILEMAALEEGDLTLNPVLLDLHEMLRRAAAGVSMSLEPSGGVIEMNTGDGCAEIEADETHLASVIYNLLDNAVKYSVAPAHIVISTSVRDDCVTVVIEDNGIGIGKSDIKHIFDRYYRVPTGNLHDVKGFGLGLSYVKLIVEAHGGSIAVRSTPGEGSTFTIRLPRRRRNP